MINGYKIAVGTPVSVKGYDGVWKDGYSFLEANPKMITLKIKGSDKLLRVMRKYCSTHPASVMNTIRKIKAFKPKSRKVGVKALLPKVIA